MSDESTDSISADDSASAGNDGRGMPSSSPSNETARLDRNGSGLGPIEVWERWRGPSNASFHAYCEVIPQFSTETIDKPDDGLWIKYTQGIPRTALKYTPVLVFLSALFLLPVTELASAVGIDQLIQSTESSAVRLQIVSVIAWIIALVLLLRAAGIISGSTLFRSFFIYGLLSCLLAGVVFSVYTSSIAAQQGFASGPSAPDITGLSWSGFLLTLFLGGQLVYDGMLRTENMFSRLHEKSPPIIGPVDFDPEEYSDKDERDEAFKKARSAYQNKFLGKFNCALNHKIKDILNRNHEFNLPGGWLLNKALTIRTVYLFAVLFVAPFFFTGLALARGSFTGDFATLLRLLVPTLLNVILVIVFFQFLVLIKYFNDLLTDHSPYRYATGSGFTLRYQPDHPDGHAGFRDMGRFATRVNTLLFIGGLLNVYRIYVVGLPAPLPAEGGGVSQELLLWGFNFLGPFAVYTLAVVVWLYLSFWQIHKAMRRGRARRIMYSISKEYDGELADGKQGLRNAPTWPINVRAFISLVIGDMLPLLSLLPLVQV